MITFATQKDFEDAVMSAIRFRTNLNVQVDAQNDKVNVKVVLRDTDNDVVLARGMDADTVVIDYSDIRNTP